MTKKIKLIIIFLVVIIISTIIFFIVAYLNGYLEKMGICKPGEKIGYYTIINKKYCYKPSGYEGQFCDKQTDCGTASCVLINENKTTGKGVCKDKTFSECGYLLNKNGDKEKTMCFD